METVRSATNQILVPTMTAGIAVASPLRVREVMTPPPTSMARFARRLVGMDPRTRRILTLAVLVGALAVVFAAAIVSR